jgi:hypothetical protein
LEEVAAGVFFVEVFFGGATAFVSSSTGLGFTVFDLVGLASTDDLTVPFLDAVDFLAVAFVAAFLLDAGVLAVDFLDGDDAEFATDRAKGNLNE